MMATPGTVVCAGSISNDAGRQVQRGVDARPPSFRRSPWNDAPEYRPQFLLFLLSYLFCWSHPPGLNRRPTDYESVALPAELGWPSGQN